MTMDSAVSFQAAWNDVCAELELDLGKDTFRNWIAPLGVDRITGQVLHLVAPMGFIGRYVDRNFGQRIIAALGERGVDVARLEFRVCARDEQPKRAAPGEDRAEAPIVVPRSRQAEDSMPGAPLDPRFTFDRFVVGKPNELAAAAARRVAEGGAVSFNPLFLYGGVGLGKTHLMHAIAWEFRRKNPDYRVLYLSAEQFMYRFVQAMRGRNTMEFKEMFRAVDVLMVDDVQFLAGKDSTQDEFFHTFNALIEQRKQLVISGDRAPGEMDGVEERIRSRLGWGLVVDLHPTDYELRLGILQSKAEAYMAEHPELRLRDGVLEFLAHRISSNVRVLEGALTRLFAFGTLVGREIDLDMATECLSDILRLSERKVTIDEIIRKVCEHYNVRMSDMMSPRRARAVARPRQIAMYLSKHLTSKSLPEIGRRFGGRDHTTVLHAVRRVEELKSSDGQIAEDLELLRRMLEA
ncbi:MAG: chromosomal replication initiator protein DnaA [Rubricella sp.]